MINSNPIKDNIVLITGIVLPVLLGLFFAVAASLPKIVTDPPEYNFLFITNYYPQSISHNDIRLTVDNKKLKIQYRSSNTTSRNHRLPRLYHYNVKTQHVTEILYDIPKTESTQWSTLTPSIQQELLLNDSLISPDGYQFTARRSSNSGPLGLFRSRPGSPKVLSKGGNLVEVRARNTMDINLYSARFFAWVENE